jgi:hypothetical protein
VLTAMQPDGHRFLRRGILDTVAVGDDAAAVA